jgi:hypothetical protein
MTPEAETEKASRMTPCAPNGSFQSLMKPQESEAETEEAETKAEAGEKDPLRSPFFDPEVVSSESQDLALHSKCTFVDDTICSKWAASDSNETTLIISAFLNRQ